MGIRYKDLIYYRDLIFVLTSKEIKIKYKSSFLGYLWSLLYPLSFTIVFYFAFKFVMKLPVENFTLFLITGLFPWQWFSNSVGYSAVSLLGNAQLIKKVKFPAEFIPLSNVLNDTFHFIISLPIIIGFLIFYDITLTFKLAYMIPMVITAQFLITYGIALVVSSINLFFRDLEKLVNIFLNMLFYFTPIVYDIDFVPQNLRKYFLLNPLYPIIENWHDLFLRGDVDWDLYTISAIWATGIFIVGFIIFRKLSWKFAEVL